MSTTPNPKAAENETPELLPLGSAVRIEDDEGVYVVIARGFQKHNDGFLAGYKAVPHPQGAASGVREIVIRSTQITKVVHSGYETEKDAVFAKEQLANAKTPPKKPPARVVEPDLTVDLKAPAKPALSAPSSPVAAAGGGASSPGIVRDAKDPFRDLRNKGKQ
ncbi:MAG: DUF4176 domain-containing protein [Aeromicrobium sp.]|uniref:DUF4176 domain-containing protein n=1 Tax=Aeromicrobium sp. TaxID=1871063 RepID=UPI0039E469F5